MGYFVPETAPGASDLTAKNRAGGFLRGNASVSLKTRRAAPQPRRENYADRRGIVSGIPYWLSRDPIGEEGGINLYAFVRNNGVNKFDFMGLTCTCTRSGNVTKYAKPKPGLPRVVFPVAGDTVSATATAADCKTAARKVALDWMGKAKAKEREHRKTLKPGEDVIQRPGKITCEEKKDQLGCDDSSEGSSLIQI